jgi:hypothetical protein
VGSIPVGVAYAIWSGIGIVLISLIDKARAAVLGRWTTRNIGAGLAVVFRGRVLAEVTILGPLTTGSLVLGGSEVLANRDAIELTTVPSPWPDGRDFFRRVSGVPPGLRPSAARDAE